MNAPANVKFDNGAANTRILGRELVADYRRVEQGSIKTHVRFSSPEAKRLYARFFHSLQLNAHFCSDIARTRLPQEAVEAVEQQIRNSLDNVKSELARGIQQADLLFQQNGIQGSATYDTVPLEMDVGVISSMGRRFLECLQQIDDLMPKLITLEVFEVITPTQKDIQRAHFRRLITKPAKAARHLASGLRKRMNEAAKLAAEAAAAKNEIRDPARVVSDAASDQSNEGHVDVTAQTQSGSPDAAPSSKKAEVGEAMAAD